MKKYLVFSVLLFIATWNTSNAQNYLANGGFERIDPAFDRLVPKDAKIEVIGDGFDWTEGPLWIPDGDYLLFADIPPNNIHKWKNGEGISLYLHPSGYTSSIPRGGEVGSNGMILDLQGRLVLCQHGDRRIAYMRAPLNDPKPKFITLADRYEGKPFNSPNDIVIARNGNLYFTDPPYGLEKNINDPSKVLDFQGVYLLRPDGEIVLLTDKMTRPNGIVLTPDQKTLYVANSDENQPVWMAYSIKEDGTIDGGRVFFDARNLASGRQGGGDGMKIDTKGNMFTTGPGGVLVISPEGKHLGTILTGRATSNCAFGEDGKTLFITADDIVLRIRTNTTGFIVQ